MKRTAGRLRSLARPRRGQAIIETALVLPILVVLVFGIADMGLYMFKYIQASNCAREAARLAALRDPDADSVSYCVSDDLQPSVNPNNYINLEAGEEVTGEVEVDPYDWVVLDNLVPGLPTTLTASVTMRMEGEPNP